MVSHMLKKIDDLREYLKLESSCLQLLISKLQLELRVIGGIYYLQYWDPEDAHLIQIELSEEEYNALYAYLGPKFKEMNGW